MALQGYNDPFVADESGTSWATETNVFASDGARAQYTGALQAFLQVRDFRFQLPSVNAIIMGVEVSVEGFGAAAAGAETEIEVSLTKNGTVNVGTAKTIQLPSLVGAEAYVSAGGATDLWGITARELYLNEVDALSFGVRIRKKTAGANAIDINHVMVRVYYFEGIKGEWNLDKALEQITHIDGYLDWSAGAGGSIPKAEDVIFESATGAIAEVLKVSDASVLAKGTMSVGDVHGAATFGAAGTLVMCDYVDFDQEQGSPVGFTIDDVGTAITGGTLAGAVIRHVWSNGGTGSAARSGRLWYTKSGGALADNDVIQIAGNTKALARGAGVANAWTATNDAVLSTSVQGFLDYDIETVVFESATGTKRIRDVLGYQHNMCVMDVTSKATAMLVDDRPDFTVSTEGRLFLIDIDVTGGAFGDNNIIKALEELDFDTAVAPQFKVGDIVADADAAGAKRWTIRRMLINRDGVSGTLYLENLAGVGFVDNEALFIEGEGAGSEALANGAQRARVGSATINGTLTTSEVQWRGSHFYSDRQDEFDEFADFDKDVPSEATVINQVYSTTDGWFVKDISTQRLKTGGLDMFGVADDDTRFTNYQTQGGLGSAGAGAPLMYVKTGGAGLAGGKVLASTWDRGPANILLRNRDKGVDVDGGTRTVYASEFGNTYAHFESSVVGGVVSPVIATANDPDNTTPEATVANTQKYHDIRFVFASHRIDIQVGGSGVVKDGDVVHNQTTNDAAMVCRPPANIAAASTDWHVGSFASTPGVWAGGHVLDLLNAYDFNTQTTQFVVGETIRQKATPANLGIVRYVQQAGFKRGRVWISGEGGADMTGLIESTTGPTDRATFSTAKVVANTGTATANAALIVDNTVLKDTGAGGFNPYNLVCILAGALVLDFYEMCKFMRRDDAGSTADPGAALFTFNGTAVVQIEGRQYVKASSIYTAVKQTSPIGTFAGGKFLGAQGVFVQGMALADLAKIELTDAGGLPRLPPNDQNIIIDGLTIGHPFTVFRRTAAGIIQRDEYQTDPAAGLNEAVDTTINLLTNIHTSFVDIPDDGVVMVLDPGGSGTFLRFPYTNTDHAGAFPLTSGTIGAVTNGKDLGNNVNAHVVLFQKVALATQETVTVQHLSATDILIKTVVRKKGFKPLSLDGTSSSTTGTTVNVNIATDGIVE